MIHIYQFIIKYAMLDCALSCKFIIILFFDFESTPPVTVYPKYESIVSTKF